MAPGFNELVTIDVTSGDALQTKLSSAVKTVIAGSGTIKIDVASGNALETYLAGPQNLKSVITGDGILWVARYIVAPEGLGVGTGYFDTAGLSILQNGNVFTRGGVLINVPTGHDIKPFEVGINDTTKVSIDNSGVLTLHPQDGTNEGGEMIFMGAAANRRFNIDNFQGRMRIITQDATGESEKVRITNTGNVGIGTGPNDPGVKLEVAGGDISIGEEKRFYFNGPGGSKFMYMSNADADAYAYGRITFSYNAFVRYGSGVNNPTTFWVGRDPDNLLYLYWDDRGGTDGMWGGMLTFKRSAPPNHQTDYGYGFQPMRIWGKNVYLAPQGVLTLREAVVAPTIYFQNPVEHLEHRRHDTGAFERPDYYDAAYRPWQTGPPARELGAIQWNSGQLGVFIRRTASSSELFFADAQLTSGVRLASLVRGYADKLFIRAGAAISDSSGNATVSLSGFSSTPLFLVSCTNTTTGNQVNGQAVSAISATVKTFNGSGSPLGNVQFNWLAVGIGNP